MRYEELPEGDRVNVRRAVAVFALLVNLFLLTLVISYGSSAWWTIKGLVGAGRQLEIAVSGKGKVSARPDVARISATVLTQSESLTVTQEGNANRSQAVVAFLHDAGVEEKDVKTTGYQIFPQYRYPRPCAPAVEACPSEDTPRIVGYQIRHTLEITVRNLGKANDILGGIVAHGVNEVSGITFTIDRPEALEAEARRKAIDEARAKAEVLARDLGRSIGKIAAFSESGGLPPPVFFERLAAVPASAADPGVRAGENEVTVRVSITYEFK